MPSLLPSLRATAVAVATAALLAGCGALPTSSRPGTALDSRGLAQYLQLARTSGEGTGAWLVNAPVRSLMGARPHLPPPPSVDLRPQCPPVYEQGPFNACVGFTVAKGLGEFLLKRAGHPQALSAAFAYSATRTLVAGYDNFRKYTLGADGLLASLLDNLTNQQGSNASYTIDDTGTSLAMGMELLRYGGGVPEADAPYPPASLWHHYWNWNLTPGKDLRGIGDDPDANKLTPYFDASSLVYKPGEVDYDRRYHVALKVSAVRRLASLDELRQTLADGLPAAISIAVYPGLFSVDTRKTGAIPLPGADEQPLGGHALLCVGYDDKARTVLVRNSWGTSWGQAGYGTLPYAAWQQGLVREAWGVDP